MKPILVHYTIRINNDPTLKLAVNLEELEQAGIESWLQSNKISRPGDEVIVLSRNVYAMPVKLSKFRVFLKSIPFFMNTDFPESMDVMAESKGKAIIEVFHSSGIYDFPEDWRNIRVVKVSG